MNRKLVLNLLSSSSIFVSLMSTLGVINPAHAAMTQRLTHTSDGRTCITHPHASYKTPVCIKDSERNPNAPPVRSTTYLLWFGPFLLLLVVVLIIVIRRRHVSPAASALTAEESARVAA